jgi:hypothetical protein
VRWKSSSLAWGGASTTIVEVAGAVGVVLVGQWLARRKHAARTASREASQRG